MNKIENIKRLSKFRKIIKNLNLRSKLLYII